MARVSFHVNGQNVTIQTDKQVIASGEALVKTRDRLSIVRTFISRRALPRHLARDIVSTFYENVKSDQQTERIFGLLPSSLRVEVAMHISLPLVKDSAVFKVCTSGFVTAVSVLMHEVHYMADETIFRAKESCNDLFLVANQAINLMSQRKDGSETVRFPPCPPSAMLNTIMCELVIVFQHNFPLTPMHLQVSAVRLKGDFLGDVPCEKSRICLILLIDTWLLFVRVIRDASASFCSFVIPETVFAGVQLLTRFHTCCR